MTLRTFTRDLLRRAPLADAVFRRCVWSRVNFFEAEQRFLQSLRPGAIDVAIDVGAAQGQYAWILNRRARIVYCFEPGPAHGRYLARAAFASHVVVVNAAVGSADGHAVLYTPGADTHALHCATLSRENPVVDAAGTWSTQVPVVALDSYFCERAAGRSVDLLKVDVEGAEYDVFAGAPALLARHHPLVFCEIEQRHNANYHRVFDLLRAAGYRSYVYRSGAYQRFDGHDVSALQTDAALSGRGRDDYDLEANEYVNNFVFQHPRSRLCVVP